MSLRILIWHFQSGCERWGFHLFTQQVKTVETWGPVLTTGPTIHRVNLLPIAPPNSSRLHVMDV